MIHGSCSGDRVSACAAFDLTCHVLGGIYDELSHLRGDTGGNQLSSSPGPRRGVRWPESA